MAQAPSDRRGPDARPRRRDHRDDRAGQRHHHAGSRPVSAGTYEILNPATEEVVGEAPDSTAADAAEAVANARAAFPSWAATAPEDRARLLQAVADGLRKRAEALLPLVMAETGATIAVGSQLQIRKAI